MDSNYGKAENEASRTRRAEISGDQHPSDSDREKRDREDGENAGDIHRGIHRTAWAWGALAGGILAQLIKDAETRLSEARECVEWYQQEEQKQLQRLEELRALESVGEQTE